MLTRTPGETYRYSAGALATILPAFVLVAATVEPMSSQQLTLRKIPLFESRGGVIAGPVPAPPGNGTMQE
jgi:hypothetical protein